jgi:hypothetical protein
MDHLQPGNHSRRLADSSEAHPPRADGQVQADGAGHEMAFDPGTQGCLVSAVLRPKPQIMSLPARWVCEERKP